MRKSILMVLLVLSAPLLRADEGMWLLPLLEKMNGGKMAELGFEITPDQIYDLNHSSLKDAIVIFGGGCTGEVVSDRGLLFTNHHCGYSSIQQLSSVEHNYLKDGFWAMNLSEELPVRGLEVRFLESFTDVTAQVQKALQKAATQEERAAVLKKLGKKMQKKNGCDGNFVQGSLTSFYGGNSYYFIIYKIFKDIRFVGAPPSSIGKFGADTDNWMWPRHTGDFSVFRIYASKDNAPAEYSAENRPYVPKRSLAVSVRGYEENDPVMIMGFPGSTNRFMTASELVETREKNEVAIHMRTIRQDVLMEDMQADPAVMIQYASKYSGSSNGWKKWIGMNETFAKLDVERRRAAEEKEFRNWVNDGGAARKELYGDALQKVDGAVEGRKAAKLLMTNYSESVLRIELLSIAGMAPALQAIPMMKKESRRAEAKAELMGSLKRFYKDYSLSTDKKVAAAMIRALQEAVPEKEYPTEFSVIAKDFGGNVEAYVEDLFASSSFTSLDKLEQALDAGKNLMSDKAFRAMRSFRKKYDEYAKVNQSFTDRFYEGKKDYIGGTLEMREGEAIYPDANFTMRLTYGTVLPYYPRDAVFYKYYTTLDGVMEKEDPSNWEFEVPEKLKELWEKKDFGEYAMKNGQMPVCFISNLDITGGNSGSPIMNGRGELIGLAFDGNWESMSGDVIFEPNYQRCINVDVRYVLFIIDKFGGAGYLLDEMNIVR